MNTRIWQLAAAMALVAAVVSLVPGGPTAQAKDPTPLEQALAGKYKGTTVTVSGGYGGSWANDYQDTLKSFEDQTGIKVSYYGANQDNDYFYSEVEDGRGPDVMDFSYLGPLRRLAKEGKVVDLAKVVDLDTLRSQYDPNWLDWATVDGPDGPIIGGLWSKFSVDSLVWYPKAAFDKAGYKVPTTWAELLALSDQIVKDGGTPWCIQNGSEGTYPGYTASFWLEDIMLRTVSPADYDNWMRGELKFDSPQVRKAVQLMSDLWFKPGYAYGGREAINKTRTSEIARPMFASPTKCWLLKQPTWTLDYDELSGHTAFTDKEYGKDYDFFLTPPIDKASGAPVQVEGHITAMFHDRPEVRALVEWLTTGAQIEAWIKLGHHEGFSPNKDAQADWYTNARDRAIAGLAAHAQKAGNLHLAAGDGMWPAVNDQFYKSISAYVAGDLDLDTALKQIDAAWAAAKPPSPTSSAAVTTTATITTTVGAKPVKSVLFVGASKILNVNNDFPRLAASGQPPITIESDLAYLPASRLLDHWVSDATRKPSAREEIPSGRWDVVVLEEGVEEQPPSQRAEFVEYARKFDAAIRQAGGTTVLYMAYGPRGAPAPIVDDIATAYTGLGAELGAPVAPVALAYQRSLKERPELNLYDDIDHGNRYGNYLAACVLYATIFDRSPVGLSDRMGGMVSEADAAFLQKVAWETVTEYKAKQSEAKAPAASAGKPVGSVLFVGDSMSGVVDTYFARLALSSTPPINVESGLVLRGGAGLLTHWLINPLLKPTARTEIESGKWDVVVLEDGLGTVSDGEVQDFLDTAPKFHDEITKAGAETVLHLPQKREGEELRIIEKMAAAYSKAGAELGVKVAPVGLAFERAREERPDLNLYDIDGTHASEYGRYLGVCVLYATIFDRSPVGLSYRMSAANPGPNERFIWPNEISEQDAAFLQKVAWDTVTEYKAQQ